jgi:hypothetical protein
VRTAVARIGPIVGWTALSGTVGLFLGSSRNNDNTGWGFLSSLGGVAWRAASFFVVPTIAIEGHGPWQALKRSASIVKERWGEAAGALTFGYFAGILAAVTGIGALFALGIAWGVGADYKADAVLFSLLFIILTLLTALILIISTALTNIFRVAVYQYAISGQVAEGFDAETLQSALA